MLNNEFPLRTSSSYELDILFDHVKKMYSKYAELANLNIHIDNFYPRNKFGQLLAKGPIITYHVMRRRAASMKNPFSDQFVRPDPYVLSTQYTPNQATLNRRMYFDNIVRFAIAATSYETAILTADNFESFMIIAKDIALQNGLPELYLWERSEDETEEISNTIVYFVNIDYYVRTAKDFVRDEAIIREITTVLKS